MLHAYHRLRSAGPWHLSVFRDSDRRRSAPRSGRSHANRVARVGQTECPIGPIATRIRSQYDRRSRHEWADRPPACRRRCAVNPIAFETGGGRVFVFAARHNGFARSFPITSAAGDGRVRRRRRRRRDGRFRSFSAVRRGRVYSGTRTCSVRLDAGSRDVGTRQRVEFPSAATLDRPEPTNTVCRRTIKNGRRRARGALFVADAALWAFDVVADRAKSDAENAIGTSRWDMMSETVIQYDDVAPTVEKSVFRWWGGRRDKSHSFTFQSSARLCGDYVQRWTPWILWRPGAMFSRRCVPVCG